MKTTVKKINIKPQQRRFTVAFVASVIVHILLAVLIVAAPHEKSHVKKSQPQIMDVTLLDEKQKSAKKPVRNARTMANRNAVGSSRNAHDHLTRRAKTPMVGQPRKRRPAAPKQPETPPPPAARPKPTRMLARRSPSPDIRQVRQRRPKPVKRRPLSKRRQAQKKTPRLSNLMPSAMALSQLSSNYERERRMKQKLNREADIPINTRQVKYAPYAHALVRALEEQWRPGQARYDEFPADARQALVKLTIEHDGSLGGVEILRPSPIPQINESAIRAIQAAAPFKVLPSSWGLDRVSFYLTFEVVEDHFVFHQM